MLFFTTPAVSVVASSSAYPNLGIGVTGDNQQLFIIAVSSNHVCGDSIGLTLNLTSTKGNGSVNITLPTGGGSGAVQTFSYSAFNGDPVVNIPDDNATGVNVPLTVSGLAGTIAKVTFSIDGNTCSGNSGANGNGINHDYISDLNIKLTSPNGTTINLMSEPGNGLAGPNFCNVVFDDDASSGIQNIPDDGGPHTGSYTPQQALSAFNGEAPNGLWTVNFSDTFAPDAGNVRAFSLHITPLSACEPPSGPPNDDTDADGLPDAWELQYFGNLSAGPDDDPDNDGHSNLEEFMADTDPGNSASVFKLELNRSPDHQMQKLLFNGSVNRMYTVQWRASLMQGQWQDLLSDIQGVGPAQEVDIASQNSAGYYRIRVRLP
ncbi:MAG: proprotein convertase P-domain-containing protein [Verrucomicrobiota bacterium]